MKILTEHVVCLEESSSQKMNEIQILLQDTVDDNLESLAEQATMQLPGITQLTPHLFVCGAGAARLQALETLDVGAVINAAPELPDTPLPNYGPLYFRVPIDDRVDAQIHQYFNEVADLIEQTRLAGKRTLVHCVAGVSRSVALCLAYLIKYQSMSLRKAFQHVRGRRPQARPNSGFFRQLIEFELKTLGTSSVEMVYNEAALSDIPDVYEEDYKAMLRYQKLYNRNFGRR